MEQIYYNVYPLGDHRVGVHEEPLSKEVMNMSLYNAKSVSPLCSPGNITVYKEKSRIYLLPSDFHTSPKDKGHYAIGNWKILSSQLEVRELISKQGKVISNTYKKGESDNILTTIVKDTLNDAAGIRVGLSQLPSIKKGTEQLRKVKSNVSANKALSFIDELGKANMCEMNIELKIKDANGNIVTRSTSIGHIK